MINVMFVCLGNICRSPMAKYVFKDKVCRENLLNYFSIDSSGISCSEVGNGMDVRAKRKLEENNIDGSNHIAKSIKKSDYDKFDYFIVMDNQNREDLINLFDGDKENKVYRLLDFTDNPGEISDPWYTLDFEKAYQDINKGCEYLLRHLKRVL